MVSIRDSLESELPVIGNLISLTSKEDVKQYIKIWCSGLFTYYKQPFVPENMDTLSEDISRMFNNLNFADLKLIRDRIITNPQFGAINCPKILVEISNYWEQRITSAETLNNDKHAQTKNQVRKPFNLYSKFFGR